MRTPGDVTALTGRLLELGIDDGLVAKARQVLGDNAQDMGEWIELAVALRERKFYDAALAVYDAAMRRFPDSHVLWSNRGAVFLRWELYEQALRDFEKALSIKPDYAFALRNIGTTREHLHDFEAAADAYRRALDVDSSHAMTWNSLGVCVRELGDEEEAIGCYRKAIGLDPDFGDPLFNLAALLASRGDLVEAEKHVARLRALDPTDRGAEALLAQIAARRQPAPIRPRRVYLERTDPRAVGGPRPRDRLYRPDGARIPDDELVAEYGKISLRLALLDDAIWRRGELHKDGINYPLRLFVSYKWGSVEENDRAARLADGLAARGWDVVFDRYRDEEIDRSVEEFVSRIASCTVFVAIATPTYVAHGMNPRVEATWVFDEMQYAMLSELGMYRIALTPDGMLAIPGPRDDLSVRRSDTGDPLAPGMPPVSIERSSGLITTAIPAIVTAPIQKPRFEEIHRMPDEDTLDDWLDEHFTYGGGRLAEDEWSALVTELERTDAAAHDDAALDTLRALALEYNFVFDVWQALVLRLTGAGRADEALAAVTTAIEHVDPWDNRLLLERERINILNQLGRRLDAAQAAVDILKDRPTDWVAHFHLGNWLDDCEELWGARNHLLLACRDRFATADAFNTLGVVYLGMGFLVRARQSFEAALRRDARHELAKRNLTRAIEAGPPHAHADAVHLTGDYLGCSACPSIYPFAKPSTLVCAACGGKHPAGGRCPYCTHDGVVPTLPEILAVAPVSCPTCRVGSLTIKDAFDL